MYRTRNLNQELDEIDFSILKYLMQDATMPYTDIAKKLDLSSGTIHIRMKKMTDLGIVRGSQLLVDYHALGWDITAFLGIYLDKSSLYKEVIQELQKIPEIISMNYTTGNYSIFVKVICRDTQHLRDVLHDKIQKVVGIQRTETFISLEEPLNRLLHLESFEEFKREQSQAGTQANTEKNKNIPKNL